MKRIKLGVDHITPVTEKETKRKKKQVDDSVYIVTISDKLLDAIEKVLDETKPTPVGSDMIDAVSLASVFLFARQISLICNSKKTMQSVLKSTIWALTNQINTFADPFIQKEEIWDVQFGDEGGNDEQG